jgi:predicted AlkP superfamily pyrophosphatase or phosphodiesterase
MTDVAPTIGRLIGYRFDAPDGRAITTALDPDPQAPPRLVVTMVWDGGGWDTLRQHPRSWPYLKHLMTQGVVYGGMEIGSTPSDTPPIHTTLGTGAYPEHHGIPHVKMQTASGDYIDPFEDNSPKYIRLPTLGDVYDRAEGGRPIVGVVATVNWHLGMIGHGALYPNGDRDIAVLLNSGGYTYGDPSIYDIPSELSDPALLDRDAAALDGRDGARDGVWRGHSLEELDVRYASPAFVDFQESVLERTITTQGFGSDAVPDLLYTNFKSIDDSGHHWGQTSPEMGDAIAATDDALKQVVTFLNSRVGKRRWVLIVTADHGTAKLPEESGGWAIRGHDLEADLNRAFDRDEDDTTLIERVNSAGIYIDRDELTHGDHEIEQIGRWLLNYTAADNLYGISRIPTYYEDKADVPLFDAVMDGRKVIARSCD